MNFKTVDFSTWDRAEKYRYFTTAENCVISLTCDVDVTGFAAFLKERGLKFYTAMICAVSRAVNGDEHYRMGKRANGDVVIYDTMDPLFTDFVPEGETFNNLTAAYAENAADLYRNVTAVREKYRGVELMFPEDAPENLFSITSIPWVHYSSMELHYAGCEVPLSPIVVWGRYALKDGRLMLPVTFRIHHAVCDGFHAARFFQRLEAALSEVMQELDVKAP